MAGKKKGQSYGMPKKPPKGMPTKQMRKEMSKHKKGK